LHGNCNDGVNGTGLCLCTINFNSTLNCSNCNVGYYGNTCMNLCNVMCNGHGVCNDGINGNGSCICDKGLDPVNNCEPIEPDVNIPIGTIVGIVFGGLAGLILVFCIAFYVKRRYDRNKYAFIPSDD